MTKRLYPLVAARHETSAPKVERAMRNAIETMCTKGNLDHIHEIFAYSVDQRKGKPTNSSFIARLADEVRLELDLPPAS